MNETPTAPAPSLIERLAQIAETYAAFIRDDVRADDLERHPYLPEIEETIAEARTERERRRGAAIRDRSVYSFAAEAESIVESPSVVGVYASCDWDELHDDGKLWIAAIVQETLARAAAAGSIGGEAGEVERVMALVEERLCIIWHPRENRAVFEAELRSTLHPERSGAQ